ncbi:recombination regulator RecX, partial [Kitasatospora purpeofusca]
MSGRRQADTARTGSRPCPAPTPPELDRRGLRESAAGCAAGRPGDGVRVRRCLRLLTGAAKSRKQLGDA